MKTLNLGGICADFSCAKCCQDTAMLLSSEDIQVIENLGFEIDSFAVLTDNGLYQLQNVDGHCFFLQNNQCSIYAHRPQGCRFYPIIFDLDSQHAVLDLDCPMRETISRKIVLSFEKDLKKFVGKLLEK